MGEFAKKTEAKFEDDCIRFSWDNADGRRDYEISGAALRQVFGARDNTGSELLEAFERGREQITRAVALSLNAPTDGITELGTGDFAQEENSNGMAPP